MRPTVQVRVQASESAENLHKALVTSLRARQIKQKLLYAGAEQTKNWLELHEACSPARSDPDCLDTYEKAFAAAARELTAQRVHLIGLGCGGGQKDAQLLALLKRAGRQPSYAPCDVSRAMVLAACQSASAVAGVEECFPLVCDLEEADDLPGVMEQQCPAGADRLMTFFGMLPNFEPRVILPRLAALLGPVDWLLVSANLAPGPDYGAGVRRILPQYDNVPTRAWLMTFLLDLGVKQSDGAIRFTVEEGPPGLDLKRVVAEFQFEETCSVRLGTETFEWHRGERLRLFFSYRFTPDRVCKLLGQQGIVVVNQWVTRAEEEGVFLCRRGLQAGPIHP